MEKNIKENVISIFFVKLTMKCIFKSTLSLLDDKRCYINNKKVYHGMENNDFEYFY